MGIGKLSNPCLGHVTNTWCVEYKPNMTINQSDPVKANKKKQMKKDNQAKGAKKERKSRFLDKDNMLVNYLLASERCCC